MFTLGLLPVCPHRERESEVCLPFRPFFFLLKDFRLPDWEVVRHQTRSFSYRRVCVCVCVCVCVPLPFPRTSSELRTRGENVPSVTLTRLCHFPFREIQDESSGKKRVHYIREHTIEKPSSRNCVQQKKGKCAKNK